MTSSNPIPSALHDELTARRKAMAGFSVPARIEAEPATAFTAEGAGIHLDFKKHLIDSDTFALLMNRAQACDLQQRRDALLAGATVNITENRQALHTLLRTPRASVADSLRPLHDEVVATQDRMREICQQVRSGNWLGFSGEPIKTIVNIGIGGSDLGPRMVYRALAPITEGTLPCIFVSNIDPESIATTLRTLNPATTLFIVASKSFTTQETLCNATTARQWLLANGADETSLSRHFIAISARPQQAVQFGIAEHNVLTMWDWVGGRFSLWSAIGLPIAIALGFDTFETLLAGAHAMDTHFASAPLQQNLPTILALLDDWYVNHWGCRSHAIVPYAEQLELFPAYLQQLLMESLGKQVTLSGTAVQEQTSPVVWGTAGTNGQHSYFQLLHQGTPFISCDFIIPLRSPFAPRDQHLLLVANALAQSRVLMTGQTLAQADSKTTTGAGSLDKETLARHKAMPGNRPNSVLVVETLDAHSLGALLALYEHKTFVCSVLWDINAFDQWGVELGKEVGKTIAAALDSGDAQGLDNSTARLIDLFRRAQTD